MSKLTATQQSVYDKLSDEPQSAYDLRASLATLDAIARKGYARSISPNGGLGSMFSPRTH